MSHGEATKTFEDLRKQVAIQLAEIDWVTAQDKLKSLLESLKTEREKTLQTLDEERESVSKAFSSHIELVESYLERMSNAHNTLTDLQKFFESKGGES